MAIVWQRIGSAKMGEMASAVAVGKKIASYLDEKHGQKIEISTPIGGAINRVMWSARFDSLAAMESFLGKLGQDAQYLKMTADSTRGVFIDGATVDDMWLVS